MRSTRSLGIFAVLALLLAGAVSVAAQSATSLFAYVGTGIKDPVIELASMYQQKTGVKIEMTFNNSGSLVGQLKLNKTGDIFMPGAESFVDMGKQAGLVAEVSKPIAYHVPVIIVPKANPAKIVDIRDFGRKGVRLILPDRKATALGQAAFKIFERAGIADAVSANVVAYMESPQKVVTAMGLGQGEAGIVDYNAVQQYADRFTVIEIDPSINVVEVLPCAVLSCGAKQDQARDFMSFVEREGPAVFAKYGFKPAK